MSKLLNLYNIKKVTNINQSFMMLIVFVKFFESSSCLLSFSFHRQSIFYVKGTLNIFVRFYLVIER